MHVIVQLGVCDMAYLSIKCPKLAVFIFYLATLVYKLFMMTEAMHSKQYQKTCDNPSSSCLLINHSAQHKHNLFTNHRCKRTRDSTAYHVLQDLSIDI